MGGGMNASLPVEQGYELYQLGLITFPQYISEYRDPDDKRRAEMRRVLALRSAR